MNGIDGLTLVDILDIHHCVSNYNDPIECYAITLYKLCEARKSIRHRDSIKLATFIMDQYFMSYHRLIRWQISS
ncbi:hypothetical protein DERP_007628 [Dermatophagoides pteronyssinus]|uniref:Uncharacterized protein n=1 Tax=Dermatophagoides pteronyssinus TaxID=6956 RepID=A0ABQ8JKA1_DERPT|nr:hypothetical protein DERP_007628 [Dermatophagoides pteronyssinus]